MLLSVIDELRTNTLSKVREIRVSNIWERDLVTRKVFFFVILTNAIIAPSLPHFLITSAPCVSQDVMGFNSAALQFLQREIESKEDVMFFAEATGQLKDKKKRRRKRERAILTIAWILMDILDCLCINILSPSPPSCLQRPHAVGFCMLWISGRM